MTDIAHPDDRIADGEQLLRRIPASQNWVDIQTSSVDPLAFRPRQSDTTGLSLSRAKYGGPAKEAARGASGKLFYIAILSVDRLREAGIDVVSSPLPGHEGHAEILHPLVRRTTSFDIHRTARIPLPTCRASIACTLPSYSASKCQSFWYGIKISPVGKPATDLNPPAAICSPNRVTERK